MGEMIHLNYTLEVNHHFKNVGSFWMMINGEARKPTYKKWWPRTSRVYSNSTSNMVSNRWLWWLHHQLASDFKEIHLQVGAKHGLDWDEVAALLHEKKYYFRIFHLSLNSKKNNSSICKLHLGGSQKKWMIWLVTHDVSVRSKLTSRN